MVELGANPPFLKEGIYRMDSPTPSSPTPSSAQPAAATDATSPAALDERQVAQLVKRLRDNQNIGGAMLGGLAGALIGAGLWAIITVMTNFQIGWEAVGVGFLVGFGVRALGRGIDPLFGYVGGALSLLGIVLGNIVTGMIIVSKDQHIPFMDLASRMNLNIAWLLLSSGFSPIDLLFYGLGIYYGYRYSFHRPTAQDLAAIR